MKILLVALVVLCTSACLAQEPERIAPGKEVTLEFTVSLPDASPVASTIGREPITYIYGGPSALPALQRSLKGAAQGETRRIRLTPEEAFGPVDPAMIVELPLEGLPREALQVGTVLTLEDGHEARVREVHEKTVVVDGNHPLAGKTLIFDVKVLKVRDHAR